jgi:hypothetical protein
MSQMSMPGLKRRGPEMNVYTGILAFAVMALAIACGVMWVQGSKIGADGQPFGLQEKGKIAIAR